MAETTHTHTTPTVATKDKSLWKHGAGVAAAVASALGSLIALGIGASQPAPAHWSGYLVPAGCVAVFAVVAAICGAIVGSAVPVIETANDSTAHH